MDPVKAGGKHGSNTEVLELVQRTICRPSMCCILLGCIKSNLMILFVDKMVATEESLQEQPEQVPSDPDGELTKKILK